MQSVIGAERVFRNVIGQYVHGHGVFPPPFRSSQTSKAMRRTISQTTRLEHSWTLLAAIFLVAIVAPILGGCEDTLLDSEPALETSEPPLVHNDALGKTSPELSPDGQAALEALQSDKHILSLLARDHIQRMRKVQKLHKNPKAKESLLALSRRLDRQRPEEVPAADIDEAYDLIGGLQPKELTKLVRMIYHKSPQLSSFSTEEQHLILLELITSVNNRFRVYERPRPLRKSNTSQSDPNASREFASSIAESRSPLSSCNTSGISNVRQFVSKVEAQRTMLGSSYVAGDCDPSSRDHCTFSCERTFAVAIAAAQSYLYIRLAGCGISGPLVGACFLTQMAIQAAAISVAFTYLAFCKDDCYFYHGEPGCTPDGGGGFGDDDDFPGDDDSDGGGGGYECTDIYDGNGNYTKTCCGDDIYAIINCAG